MQVIVLGQEMNPLTHTTDILGDMLSYKGGKTKKSDKNSHRTHSQSLSCKCKDEQGQHMNPRVL